MPRISRPELFMKIAELLADRSTCSRLRVGAVLVKESRIISTGYNGAPQDLPHCDDVGCELEKGTGACIRTVHAEANVIAFAAKSGIATDGATLYTTHAPCYTCAKLLVNAGIKKVIYGKDYRIRKGLELLDDCGVEFEQFIPIDQKG